MPRTPGVPEPVRDVVDFERNAKFTPGVPEPVRDVVDFERNAKFGTCIFN